MTVIKRQIRIGVFHGGVSNIDYKCSASCGHREDLEVEVHATMSVG
jgi:hypothetical protein